MEVFIFLNAKDQAVPNDHITAFIIIAYKKKDIGSDFKRHIMSICKTDAAAYTAATNQHIKLKAMSTEIF